MKTAADLLELALEQEQIAEALEAEIGEAALQGGDLDDLMHRKAAALSKARAYRDAVRSAKDAEGARAQELARRARTQALGRAADDAEAVLDAAQEVDTAILALEQHYEALTLRILDLQHSLLLSGNNDQSRLATQLKPSLRWAMSHFAPTLSDDAGFPRVTNARRKSLAESISNLIPHIESEEAA